MANNAGVGGRETAGAVHEMKEETWDFTMWVISCFFSLVRGFQQLKVENRRSLVEEDSLSWTDLNLST